jgi:hypothetical protein
MLEKVLWGTEMCPGPGPPSRTQMKLTSDKLARNCSSPNELRLGPYTQQLRQIRNI